MVFMIRMNGREANEMADGSQAIIKIRPSGSSSPYMAW